MHVPRAFLGAATVALLVAASLPTVEAASRRGGAPRGGGAPSARSAPAARPAPSRTPVATRPGTARGVAPARTPSGSAPGVARGRATYGYGSSGGDYPYYPPYGWGDGYWGWGGYWGVGFYWDWPYSYWDWPYWGWPYAPTTAVVPEYPPDGSAPELPVRIETAVSPKSATVRLNGEEIGKAGDWNGAWDALTLRPGVHVLEFSKDGHQTFRAVVDLAPGTRFRVERVLVEGEGLDPASDPLPASRPAAAPAPETPQAALARGFLRLRIQPPDAAVYLDGEFLGSGLELERLHGAIPVAAGPHRVEVLRPGHASRVVEIDVAPGGEAARVEVALEPQR